MLDQVRQMNRRHAPDAFVFDLAVFVCQDMALADDGTPGDIGTGGLEFEGDFASGLADDFDASFHGGTKLVVPQVIMRDLPAR